MKKSGGAGYLLGDEGSAFQFGRDALRQFLSDPALASQALQTSIQQQFGTLDPGDIVAQTYRAPGPASLIAKLSKAVVADFREGAEYARRSVDRQTEALAEVTARHYRKWFSDKAVVNVCLAGGAWKGSTEIRLAFENHLNRLISPGTANVTRIEKPPLHGALTLAFMMDQRN
jgi:N-acetylglucosamine kinase-like BadF-type ATPase